MGPPQERREREQMKCGCGAASCRLMVCKLNHDFAEVVAGFEIVVRVLGIGKVEDAIDHGLQLINGNCPVHLFEHRTAADVDALDGDAVEQGGQRVNGSGDPGEHADQRDSAADFGAGQRFLQRSWAADLDHIVDAAAAGELQDSVLPLRGRAVVDGIVGPELPRSLELFIAAGCDDDPPAVKLGKLQREDRHPAGSECENRLSDSRSNPGSLGPFYDKALDLLESESFRRALDITLEPVKVRERYGFDSAPQDKGEVNGGGGEIAYARQMRGQNLLLARRLVEAGVPFINVYDCKAQGQNWDAHANCANQHKSYLLPLADRSLSALIEDLDQRGLLESTLIVAMGEFGRTPTINAQGGRDHWPHCYSVLMAGGGVQGGAVFGSSDRLGAYPATAPVTPGDLAATIYWRFGLDHATEIHDKSGRPHRLATGEPIRSIF